MLPWGTPLLIHPGEAIGRAVWRTGAYDVALSETILRLVDAGEMAVDVGANIGVMASAMGVAAGPTGRVLCFEPHPVLAVELADNIARWGDTLGWTHVQRSELAVSDRPGEATLFTSAAFAANRGTAALSPAGGNQAKPAGRFPVVTTTLDLAIGGSASIGLLKVDVEGHELEVFTGASSLLSSGRIRDVVFEEYHAYPSPVTKLLESHGYTVLLIRKGLLGPVAQLPGDGRVQLEWETPNYLATTEPDRAVARLSSVGWRSLRRRPSPAAGRRRATGHGQVS